MTDLQPYTKQEIAHAIETIFDKISHTLEGTPEGIFSQKPGQKWSIAEQMAHLIQSCFPVASALKMPKEQLANFGQPANDSRQFEELKTFYYNQLASGIQASGAFIPVLKPGTTKDTLLENWKTIKGKFLNRLDTWKDADLDAYVLPHPALGNLTIREMLMFTVFHNYHHLRAIEQLEKQFI